MKAIGMVEYKTVSSGIKAADLIVKTAEVELLEAQTVCPGKFIILFTGDLSAIRVSVDAAVKTYPESLIDSFVLGNPHESLYRALHCTAEVDTIQALGVIETFTGASAIVAADHAAKTAEVNVFEVRLCRGMCGKSYVLLTGSVAAVTEAVEIQEYKDNAEKYGFEIVDTGINTIADVEMAAKDLASKVDCISNLTDNTVVSALQTVLAAANDAKIPVFGSEVEQVKNGCVAAVGIDYVALGKQTGEMAAKVLKGEATAAETPFEICEGGNVYVNTEAAGNIDFTISDDVLNEAAEVYETITVE